MTSIRRPAVIESLSSARPVACFDLYFVTYPLDGDWAGVMHVIAREQGSTRPFADDDHDLWSRMVARVEPLLPGSEVRSTAAIHELTHVDSGIQFSFVPAGIVLSVPYCYPGAHAVRLVALLRTIASALESETGLIAYDPQAEAPFLAYGAGSAATTFEQCSPADAGLGRLPSPKRGWRRLCR